MKKRIVDRMLGVTAIAIVLLIAVWMTSSPRDAHAQTPGLAVTILRPGQGETLYSSSSTPFSAIPVTGRVWATGLDLKQLQARLDVLKGGQVSQSAALKLEADGTFRQDVGITANPLNDLTEEEHGCDGRCHMAQSPILPAGPITLRVTVSDPQGHQAVAERPIIVDNTGEVDLPVQVVVDGDPGKALAGVKVVADTRFYMWRSREVVGVTDATGHATLHLERSSQTPTNYVLKVAPGGANGAQVASRVPITVTIPAGATHLEQVTLVAQPQLGNISGSLDAGGLANLPSLTVRAVDLATGAVQTVPVAQGKFSLNDLSLDKYLLMLDNPQPATQNAWAEPQTLDLSSSPSATVTLKLTTMSAQSVQGIVHDANGTPLPFAWITTDKQTKSGRVGPTSGEFVLNGLSGERFLWVTAPGYWSRPVAVGDRLDIALTPMPDTRSLTWGSGDIVLPSLTLADVSGSQISLRRGWVWGKGSGAWTIHTPDVDVTLQGGAFALEYLPGQTNGLYLTEGQAQVTTGSKDVLTLKAGQMVIFGKGVTTLVPVALDNAAVRALHLDEANQVAIETDESFIAHVTDEIERLGIPSFLATLAGALVVAVLVLGTVWRMWQRRLQTS